MTNFTDQVILQLNGSFPSIATPVDAVKRMWGFIDGKWNPLGYANFGRSYLTISKNTNIPPPIESLNLFTYTIADTPDEPLLALDQGMAVKKDLSVGGFVASNQGALWLGSGLNNQLDVPKIVLLNSGASLLDGGGFSNMPGIPKGQSGTSFPLVPITGMYYLRTDATPQYQNRVFKYIGAGWVDTTPVNTAAKQLFRATNSFLGKAADSIFESYCTNDQWNWKYIGPASNYAGRNFDTLYIRKDGISDTPAHLDVGNITIHGYAAVHGYFGVGGTITTNLTPAASNLALGTPTERWQGVVTDTVYVKDLSPIVTPYGYGDHIKITASLNPASSGLALGSPTNKWLGVVTDTAYVKDLSPIATPYGYGDRVEVTAKLNCSAGVVGTEIAVGCAPYGSVSWPYETIQLPAARNLRINFGTTEKFSFWNSGNFQINNGNVLPASGNVGNIGTSSLYWGSTWTNYLRYKNIAAFDALDDLALAKNYKVMSVAEDGVERQVIDPESLSFLRADSEEVFFDNGKTTGFLLGCVKALVQRVEALEKQLNQRGAA